MSRLQALAGRRLLFLNWRDPAHPSAGGAELYCWQAARRFAAAGAEVTVFSSRPDGLPADDRVDGVAIVRAGGRFGVYFNAARYLRSRGDVDAVVDVQNGIPFFAPLFVPPATPVVGVIHHVHQQQFSQHFTWPMSSIGRLLEGPVSRVVYRSHPIVAVSPSTRDAVRHQLGFRNPIHIVPNGVEAVTGEPGAVRSASPRIAVVTRLVVHKRIHLLIQAVPVLLRVFPSLEVDITGDGPDRARLQRLAASLGVAHAVRFHGRVSDVQRNRLLGRAWLTVNASSGEGWGLSVLEANALGVPALAYDVPGLRDSVLADVTGWLIPGDAPLFPKAYKALRTLADPTVAARFADRCRSWARQFSWSRTAECLGAVVAAELDGPAAGKVRQRRRPGTDSACVIQFDGSDQGWTAQSARLLRRTDVVRTKQGQVALLLHGADEHDALTALRRLGLTGPVSVRLARGMDQLTGPVPFAGKRAPTQTT